MLHCVLTLEGLIAIKYDVEMRIVKAPITHIFQNVSKMFSSQQVAGQYLQQYEVYYKRLDPEGSGKIAAMDAATFLKKSQLPDETLGKVLTQPTF